MSLVIGQHNEFMLLTKLTLLCFLSVKVQKYIRMWITILESFIWRGISSYNMIGHYVYSIISNRISANIHPQMKNFNMVIP